MAAVDAAFIGCGKKVGLEIWRIENFAPVPWPAERFGEFYRGDSYIVLKTNQEKDGELTYDLHFWIGAESSQDEYGAVAIKTVELDQYLEDKPIQRREVDKFASKLFKSYFEVFKILDGGADSGFKHVEKEEFKPRLLRVRGEKRKLEISEVACKRTNLDSGDVFILDLGEEIHQWNGKKASPKEKNAASAHVQELKSKRGKCKTEVHDEVEMRPGDEFYDRCFPITGPRDVPDDVKTSTIKSLYRVSDASGKSTFAKEKEGKIVLKDMQGSGDVFVFDAMHTIYVYKGKGCSSAERLSALKFGDEYQTKHGLRHLPIVVLDEGKEARCGGFLESLDQ